jgi:tetratricopeptide (TPR) repeat protein
MVDLSYALRNSGDLKSAHAQLTRAEDLVTRSGLKQSTEYARLLMNRGRIEIIEARIPEAQVNFSRSLELYRRVVGTQSAEVAEVLGELSETFMWIDNYAAAERAARQAIAIFEATVPSIHPDRVRTQAVLAEALYLLGQQEEAAAILLDALKKNTQLFGPASAQVADVLDRLAIVRYAQGQFVESESVAREALTIGRLAYGPQHPMTGSIATTLGRTLVRLQKYTAAETSLREALNIFSVAVPSDHQYVASSEYFLGEVLLATHRLNEAETVLMNSMTRWNRSGAPPWRAARSANALGEALYRQGRTQEAEKYLFESFHQLATDTTADAPAKEKARERFERYVRKPSRPVSTPASKDIATQ